MSAAPLITLAPPVEQLSCDDKLIQAMRVPHQITSRQLLELALYPSHLDLIEQFNQAVHRGEIRPPAYGQILVPFELFSKAMMAYQWQGAFDNPTYGFIAPLADNLGTSFIYAAPFGSMPGADPLQDLLHHNSHVGEVGDMLSEGMRLLDEQLSRVLVQYGIRSGFYKPFSPLIPGQRHDIGKFSRVFSLLSGRRQEKSKEELELFKIAHTLIGGSIVDQTIVEERAVTTNDLEHFIMQIAHHWFFRRYPQFRQLPSFEKFGAFIPLIEECADILVSYNSQVRLSQILEMIVAQRDIYKTHVFLGVIKAAIVSVADEYVARTERHRPYQIVKGMQMTPEEARQQVIGLIRQSQLPYPFLDAFSQMTEPCDEPMLTLELGRERVYAA